MFIAKIYSILGILLGILTITNRFLLNTWIQINLLLFGLHFPFKLKKIKFWLVEWSKGVQFHFFPHFKMVFFSWSVDLEKLEFTTLKWLNCISFPSDFREVYNNCWGSSLELFEVVKVSCFLKFIRPHDHWK